MSCLAWPWSLILVDNQYTSNSASCCRSHIRYGLCGTWMRGLLAFIEGLLTMAHTSHHGTKDSRRGTVPIMDMGFYIGTKSWCGITAKILMKDARRTGSPEILTTADMIDPHLHSCSLTTKALSCETAYRCVPFHTRRQCNNPLAAA